MFTCPACSKAVNVYAKRCQHCGVGGATHRVRFADSLDYVDKALHPPGQLYVQRFADTKRSRVGFGDVVFVPTQQATLDDQARARLRPLLAVADPTL